MANHHLWDAVALNIYNWARPKAPQIRKAFAMKGGWEGWLQVELGLFLANQNHVFNVAREQWAFTTNQKADLVVLSDLPQNGGGKIRHRDVIELKCESQYQDCVLDNNGNPILAQGTQRPQAKDANNYPIQPNNNIAPTIVNRLRLDINKGQNITANLNTQFSVIGFSNTSEAKSWAVRQSLNNNQFEFATLGVDNESLLMWYYKHHYP